MNRWLEDHVYTLFLILLLSNFVLLAGAISGLSISEHEARIVYQQQTLLHELLEVSFTLFGQNDYGLRLPFVVIHLLNTILIYRISRHLLRHRRDALLSALVFTMLPGITSAALLVSKSGIVIFCVLLFVYIYRVLKKEQLALLLLPLFLLLDNAFAVMFLALFFFGIAQRDHKLVIGGALLFGLSMSLFGFDSSGKPRGYLPDTFGVYAAIFSPLVFLYFIYAIYRIGIKEFKPLLWHIVATALFLSLLLSLRQKVRIEDFAPFFVVGIPLMMQVFFKGLRVRLRPFRTTYRGLFLVAFVSLGINYLAVLGNHWLYPLLQKPERHFAYDYHAAKELAAQLQALGLEQIVTEEKGLGLRLRFYGIASGGDHKLVLQKQTPDDQEVSIFYTEETILKRYVTKIPSIS